MVESARQVRKGVMMSDSHAVGKIRSMHKYHVSGLAVVFTWDTCECCGQEYESERECQVSIDIEAINEREATRAALQAARPPGEEYCSAEWAHCETENPLAIDLGPLPEDEVMRRVGAPTLF